MGDEVSDREGPAFETLFANIWLLFLVFPTLAIVSSEQFGSGRKAVAVLLIAVFAISYSLGFRAQFVDAARSTPVFWFAAQLVIAGVGFGVGGWSFLGVLPFVISFAVFSFNWTAAIVTFVLSLSLSIIGPLVTGELDDLWFLSVIVLSAGGSTLLVRKSEERQGELAGLQTQLVVSDERARLARDVHDVLGHSLTAIILKVQVVDRMIQQAGEDHPALASARAELTELETVSRRALAEIRSTVHGLRTADLADELQAARSVLADAGVELTVVGDLSSVEIEHRTPLAWVVREAVTNIIRHARATRCEIDVGADGMLRISDDGAGRKERTEGNGIHGLRERLEAVELDMVIEDGDGTTLRVVPASGRPGR